MTDHVPALSTTLEGFAGVKQYRGGDDQFTALGDAHGLLLVMKRGRVIRFDAPEKNAVTVFSTGVKLRGISPGQH